MLCPSYLMPTDRDLLCSRGNQEEGSGTPIPGPHVWDPPVLLAAVSLLPLPSAVLLPSLHTLPLVTNLPTPFLESQPPRNLDSEVFCDSLEQLEPELVS